MSTVPVFVPVVLSEEQAIVTLGAVRTIFNSGVAAGMATEGALAPLAQAMVALAEATDEARARAREAA